MSFADFDRFVEEKGYKGSELPEAFAAWLANKTGKRVTGIATDLSGAVQADPSNDQED
jgi:hypothetical protein